MLLRSDFRSGLGEGASLVVGAGSAAPVFRLRRSSQSALSILECAIAVAILGLIASSALAALGVLNKHASGTRIMTNAREIVQRNIEAASAATFNSGSIPAILAFGTNVVWDDDGGGDNLETIYLSRDGTAKIKGTLYRTVTAESNGAGADIRRVNFRLAYTLSGRALSYDMTTIRATD